MGKPRILVVEDDAILRMVVASMAKHFEYEATITETCGSAKELFAQETFDIVLMDWQMEVKDGLQCALEMREMEKLLGRRTPIVAMTGNVNPDHRAAVASAGMDDFLAKPFTMHEFKAIVEKFAAK